MIIMGMHIDKARSYDVTSSINHFFGVGIFQVTNGSNVISRNRNISKKRFGTRAVYDSPTANQQVTSIRSGPDTH
jgi:hypothetical protein